MSDTLALCYHAVSPSWPSILSVDPSVFERQVTYLVERGYEGVTFHDAIHGESGNKKLAVTFDDAYRSVFKHAYPILSRLGVLGTVFVPTNHAGSETPMCWPGIDDWQDGPHSSELIPMSWEELGKLAEAGWEIGSHTCSHPRLPELADESLQKELVESREECERRLGTPCRSLAYPYGAHDARVIEATGRAGYSAAGTLPGHLHEASPLRWPRVGIYPADGNQWRFWAKVSPPVRALRSSRLWKG